LVWEAIKRAKKMGCRTFDFEGIDDPRFPIRAWRGFSHFKKSFGGKEIDYPGCFKKARSFFNLV
jgi:lipid II:glycine glycyltransferase (peptidoglycan interpeptide bridge formation enzyme)